MDKPTNDKSKTERQLVEELEEARARIATLEATEAELRQRVEALRQDKRLLDVLMDNVPYYIYFKDRENRFIRTAKAHAMAFGLDDPREVVGKTDLDFFSIEHAQQAYEDEQKIIRTGDPLLNVEERETWSDRPDTWVLTSKMPLYDEEGDIIGTFGISTDITKHRLIEEELARERNLLRTLIDNLPDIVYAKDAESRFIVGNAAVGRLMGVTTPDELIGKTDFDFYPQETAAQYYAGEQEVISSGQPLINREEPLVDMTSDRKGWISTTKVPLCDEQGRVVGLVGIGRDISEHKRIEEALAQERNLLRTLIDNLPDHIYAKDAECRFTLGNIAVGRVMGVTTPDELIGKTDFDFYPREMAEEYYASEQEVISSGQPLIHEELLIDQMTGDEIWSLATQVPLRDEQGRVVGLVGIGSDITERKRAEEELAQERNLLRTLIDNLPDIVYVKDAESRYAVSNTAHWRFLGATRPDEIVGKSVFEIYPQEMAEKYYADDQKVIHSGQPLRKREERSVDQAGDDVWLLTTKVPLRDERGQVVGLVGISRDITEQKRAAEELENRVKQLTALNQASQAVTASLELQQVLDEIVSMASEVTASNYNTVVMVDEMGRLSTSAEILPNVPSIEDRSRPEGLTHWIIRSHQAAIVNDVDENGTVISQTSEEAPPALNPHLFKIGVRSLAGLPLIIRDRLLGVLFLASLRPYNFQGQFPLLTTFANQVAVAIENARLFEETRKHAGQLQAAAEISRAASSFLDPGELLRQAVDLIRRRFDLYYSGIFLVDEAGQYAVLRAGTGEAGRKMLERGHKLEIGGESMIGWCVANAQARIALDVGQEAVRFENPLLPDTHSEMALPLISRGQVIGAITVQSAEMAAFSAEDITILQTMADQLANAIENARLFEQSRTALQEVTAVHRQYIREEWKKYMAAKPVEERTGYLYDAAKGVEAARLRTPEIERAMEQGSTVALAHIEDGHEDAEIARARAALVTPITLRGQPIGVLGFEETEQAREWTEEEITLVEGVTNQLALAIENARLFEETQDTLEETGALYQASSRIAEANTIEEVVAVVIEQIQEILAGEYTISLSLAGPDPRKPAEWVEIRALWDTPGRSTQAVVQPGARFAVEQHPLLRLFPSPQEPILIADMLTDERVDEASRQVALASDTHGSTFIPLVTLERWLGIINVGFAEARVPDERQLRLLCALADRAAIAIENRLLFEETQALARRERLINEITARVRGSMDLDTIMQTAVQELGKALGGSAFIRLGTETQLLPPEFKARLGERERKLPGDGDGQGEGRKAGRSGGSDG
jgi:PAS domain S-box-containing protein